MLLRHSRATTAMMVQSGVACVELQFSSSTAAAAALNQKPDTPPLSFLTTRLFYLIPSFIFP